MEKRSKYIVVGTIFLLMSTVIFSFVVPYYDDMISKKEQQISDVFGDYQTKYAIYETAGMSIQTGERILDEINAKSEYIPITDEYVLSMKRAALFVLYPAAYGEVASEEIQNKWKRITNFDELEEEKNKLWNIINSNDSHAKTILKELKNLEFYKSRLSAVGIFFQIMGFIFAAIIPNFLDEDQRKRNK